jgi:hypothetical protein
MDVELCRQHSRLPEIRAINISSTSQAQAAYQQGKNQWTMAISLYHG